MDWLTSILDSSFWQAILLAILTGLAGRFLAARGKLIWSVSHQHFYALPRLDADGSFPVRTQQIWFQNAGRSSIQDIEIILNWRPQHFEIWNPRQYATATLPDGRLLITLPNLSGQEAFTLSMIDTFKDLPAVLNIRCNGGPVTNIAMMPQRVWPNWVLMIVAVIMIAGVTAGLFLLLQAVLWFAQSFSVVGGTPTT